MFQADDQNHWKSLLTLVELLIDQPSPAAQQELIEETARALLNGKSRLWLADGGTILPVSTAGKQGRKSPPTKLMRQALRQQQTILSPLSEKDGDPSIATSLAAPLVSKNNVFGIIEVERPHGPAFTQEDIESIERLAALSAVALQVNRQVTIKNWRYEQLALVREVSSQIANVLDLDELSRQVTRLIRDAFHYYYVAIFTVEPGVDALRYRASAHQSRSVTDSSAFPIPSIRPGEGIIGYVAQEGAELLASDIKVEPHYRHFDSLPETQSEVAFPLKVENRILGVLDVQSDRTGAFHEMDILVLRALADNIALAVEGARLYHDLKRRAEQLSIVGEVSRTLTGILELDPLLDEVVHIIQERLGYPFVHLFTVHPGRRKVIYRAGSGPKKEQMQAQEVCFDLDDPLGIISWAARNGKTFIANNVDSEPLYRPSELPPHNTRAEMAVPLVYGGEISGVLDIQSDKRDVFTEDDRHLFEALADTISIAVHNAMLYRSERWRRQVAESLRDVAGLLSSETALDKVLDAILVELKRILPGEVAAIWLLEGDQWEGPFLDDQPLHLAAVHGGDKERLLSEEVVQSPESHSLLIKALGNNQPVVRTAQDPLGPIGIGFSYPDDYSSILVPLRAGKNHLGVLVMAHPSPGRYGSEAQSMTAAFASYAAVAIQNNRLYSSAQEQAWVSTVMLQVADAAQTANTVDELFEIVLRLTPMLVGIKSCALFTWNPSMQGFTLAAEYEMDPLLRVHLQGEVLHLDSSSAFQHLYQTAAPVTVHDLSQEFGLALAAPTLSEPSNIQLFPLAARGEFLGAFFVEHQNRSGKESLEAYSNQRDAILQGIAQQTAIAVENIRLLEAKQEEAYVTAVLLQVAQAVVSLSDLNDILEAVVHIMPILVGIDACVIYLWDSDFQMFRPSHVYAGNWKEEADLLAHPYAPEEFLLLKEVFDRDALVVCSLDTPPQPPLEWCTIIPPEFGIDAREQIKGQNDVLLGVPLSVKGDVLGVMVAQESSVTSDLRERRLEIITGIAQQAALAIQNDRLNREMLGRERLEREFQLAREIQQTFLPSELPTPSGWEVDVRWRTARRVGGDFYDCFDLPGNRLGLVIADVSDKGMPAALYMTVTRTLIRATALEGASPSEVLMRVNDLLLMDSKSGMFVTAIYAIISLDTGEMVYANAGHNLPLHIRHAENIATRLEGGGTALGAWEDIQLTDHSIHMDPGDLLLFYTDGVTEAFSATSDAFGENRLMAVLQNGTDNSATRILNAIDSALIEFLGDTPPTDDITLLAICRCQGDS